MGILIYKWNPLSIMGFRCLCRLTNGRLGTMSILFHTVSTGICAAPISLSTCKQVDYNASTPIGPAERVVEQLRVAGRDLCTEKPDMYRSTAGSYLHNGVALCSCQRVTAVHDMQNECRAVDVIQGGLKCCHQLRRKLLNEAYRVTDNRLCGKGDLDFCMQQSWEHQQNLCMCADSRKIPEPYLETRRECELAHSCVEGCEERVL